ncbi:spore germination protein [Pullulanibacillus sp. KACC 23026]|uniref:spore germination protein n=1 Tax=Pullulanibacillus sp. KACC 23026 TaxID=3028315 RepID=UPI0023B17285|nr:spore germination protein [Pullulanibacillus sp. KACC 23026]WEG11438.1 spore germination protein [Pullulanibacillus sp. KACC 23026]
MKDRLDIGTNFDVGVREMKILDHDIGAYYCTGLCDSSFIIELFRELLRIEHIHRTGVNVKDAIKNHLAHQQVMEIKTLDEVVDQMLSGLIVILIDGEEVGLVVDVRSYPGRTPEEPDIERVVRGAKDGFTENIIVNTALIRRRIRDERYRNEIMRVGERSKTDVCICYLQDVANPGLLKTLKKALKQIEVDGIPMADKTLEEYIVKQGWNPFPLVRYTQRPDVAAAHLLEGHILVICDTSPSVIIFPTTFFHHMQHAEEYRQTPIVGALLRLARFTAVLTSILIVPLWILMVMHPDLLPHWLEFIGPNKKGHIPLWMQIVIAEIGIEIIRMAAVHTPTSLSTALGLIAAVLIGQIAVQVGVFSPEVILYISIATIGSYATPSYELGLANKVVRVFITILAMIFGVPGFTIGLTLVVLYLARCQNLNTPYLWPFIPFNPKAFLDIMIRTAMPDSQIRPSIVRPQDSTTQPTN